MLVPSFSLNLGHKVLPKRVTIGCYDGVHPCLTAATIGDKVLIHNPHNRAALRDSGGRFGSSPLDVSLLNINQPVNALSAGRLTEPSSSSSKSGQEDSILEHNRDTLLVGTPTSLLAYDVLNNSELFYKEMTDGVNALTIGHLGHYEMPLAIAGGNCTIQGFDCKGNDPFWTVTGDNVTSLCLTDYNTDGKLELIVGSEDYDIRVFVNDEIVADVSETETVTAVCSLQGSIFGYALANGTVGAYNGLNRCWRIKSKNQVVSILGFDLNMDGVVELITGWSNGKIDARNIYTGEVIFKDSFDCSVAGIVVGDYLMNGNAQLICVSTEGEIRGYMASPYEGGKHSNQIDFGLEQDTIRDLSQKKQALVLELKNYEENVKLGQSGQTTIDPLKHTLSGPQLSVIPADSQLHTTLAVNLGSATQQPHVELTISTSNDTVIRAVMIFAEGVFEGESHVVHPQDGELSGTIQVTLLPPRDIPVDLHIKVLVGNKGSQLYHVFELTRQLPRFSMYSVRETLNEEPKGSAKFHLNERVQRILLWVNQNFLLVDDLELKQGSFNINLVALRTNKPLILTMEQSGQMAVRTDDMALAGEIFQAMATFLNLEDVPLVADFPDEMTTLASTLQEIEDYNSTRETLLADMADNSSIVRSLVVRAEDARLLGDLGEMKQRYSELYSLNQEMMSNYKIRCNNQQQLFDCLKSLNQVIQKASQLRVGKSKTRLIGACRSAIKNKDFNILFKIIKTGAV